MKIYAINVKGLMENELTLRQQYKAIRTVGERYLVQNNYGYDEWYGKQRFETLNPMPGFYDDPDIKIYSL